MPRPILPPPQLPYGFTFPEPAPGQKDRKWPWFAAAVAVLAVIGVVNSGPSAQGAPVAQAPLTSHATPAAEVAWP